MIFFLFHTSELNIVLQVTQQEIAWQELENISLKLFKMKTPTFKGLEETSSNRSNVMLWQLFVQETWCCHGHRANYANLKCLKYFLFPMIKFCVLALHYEALHHLFDRSWIIFFTDLSRITSWKSQAANPRWRILFSYLTSYEWSKEVTILSIRAGCLSTN